MRHLSRLLATVTLLTLGVCSATAPTIPPYDEAFIANASEEEKRQYDWEHVFLHSLNYQDGEIELPGGFAKITVPDGFYYLSPEDAERLFNEAWGMNYGEYQGEGLILSSHLSPLIREGNWSVAIFFNEFGHASEERALSFDAEKLVELKTKSYQEKYDQKVAAGEVGRRLAGSYILPTFNKEKHMLSWADKLQYSHREEYSIRYEAMIFGRYGNLQSVAIEREGVADEVLENFPNIVDSLEFLPGYRYTDVDPGVDEEAYYDIIEYYGYEDIPTNYEKLSEYFAEIISAAVVLVFFILIYIFRSSANRKAQLALR